MTALNLFANAQAVVLSPASNTKISLYFPVKQGNSLGDEFADDCLHRQLVCCLCRRILLSGIGANYPMVSLRKLGTTDSGEPNLDFPTVCLTQFSQVPPSRFGSFQ